MASRTDKQLNVRLSEETLRLVPLLCAHHSSSRGVLIERLIKDAAKAAKAEIAARPPFKLPPPDVSEDEIDEMGDERFARHKSEIDHI